MASDRATVRAAWRRAVSAEQFSVGMRPVKATLLALPMDADGMVTAWRDDLAGATGLPVGTLKRHLARATETGWLAHETKGGHGRRGSYRARLPESSCGPEMGHKHSELWPMGYTTTSQSCGPRGGPLNKDSARASGLVAVHPNRERRTDYDGGRAEPEHDEKQLRIDERAPRESRLAAVFRITPSAERNQAS